MTDKTAAGCFGSMFLIWLTAVIISAVGWINHLMICFREGEWGFLIAGAIFFPVGVVHGWGRIFGWW